jgi:archaellum biogenesis ATPase FlaH
LPGLDVQAYLAGKGFRGRPASGGRELVYPCFFDCAEPADGKKRKLYINVEEAVYSCKICGATGGPYTLQKHFGDDPRAGTSDDAFTRRRILAWAVDAGAQMLANRDDVLLYLMTERGLLPETIIERQLGFVGNGWSLTGSLPAEFTRDQLAQTGLVWRDGPRAGNDYFYNHLLIPIISRGQPIQIRGRAWGDIKGAKYMSGPGESVRAYNIDSLDGADEVILTEGEFDAIRLAEVLATSSEERARRIAVVGLPGTNAWPDELDDYLAGVKRIYLGFDSDEPGKLAAEKLREKFGARARVLHLPNVDGRKADWTEYLLPIQNRRGFEHEHPYAGHDAPDVLRLMSEAAGKRIHSVAEAGAAFRAYRAGNTGLQTGWHQLDAAIAPGLLPGQIMFILAKTGAGKTLILCNLAYLMRRYRILFISLEMTREEVYSRLQKVYWHHNPDVTIGELEYALANVWICDENRLGERDLIALVAEYEMENGAKPDVVFVDYLGYYARGARGSSPYEKTTNAAMQLKADAKAGRLVIISPAQVNRIAKDGKSIDLDGARDSGAVEETGDFVLAAVRPDSALNEGLVNVVPTWKIMLTVLKSRHGGVGKNVQLQMDSLTLALCEVGTHGAKIAEQHNFLYQRGKTWEQLRADQTAPRQLSMPGTAS